MPDEAPCVVALYVTTLEDAVICYRCGHDLTPANWCSHCQFHVDKPEEPRFGSTLEQERDVRELKRIYGALPYPSEEPR